MPHSRVSNVWKPVAIVGCFLTLLCVVTGERGFAVLGYEALRDFFGGPLADALLGALS